MVLSVLLSVSAVCASEITVIDSYDVSSDISVSGDLNVDNASSKVSLSSEEILKSANGNALSTNDDSSELTAGAVSTKLVTPDRTVNIEDAVEGYDYQIILKDVNGNPLSGKEVSFDFNGKKSTEITNSNGWANSKLTADTSGNYDVKVTFKGDSDYNGVYQVASIKIIKNEVNFIAPDRTLYLEDISAGYIYPVILRDIEGNALSKKQITLTFNGKTLTGTTGSNGYCYFNITADKVGSYGVSLSFDGDQYYYGKSSSNFKTVEVIVMKNVTFIAPDRTLHVEDISAGYNYPVLLRDSDGNALAKKQISLIFNGKKYEGTTNSKGYCYFNITVNRANSYQITLNFEGDKYYYSKYALHYKTVNVIKWNVTFVAPDRSVYLNEISCGYSYPVLLKDSKNHALTNKQITLTFNGKTLTGTTDSNGYCYFNITVDKAGSYDVSLKFAGDRYCNSMSRNNFKTVEVIFRKDVTFVAPDRTLHLADIYEGYNYPVLLRDSDGKALANKNIILTFNGKKLAGTTDNKGYCYFNINTDKAGSYPISLEFAGDKYYCPNLCSNYRTVKVLRHDTGIAWKSGTSFAAGSLTIKILLTDNGVALPNREVKLTVNSEAYSAKTDSMGYATFNLYLNHNTYTVKYAYEGENWYNPSSGSVKITVTKRTMEGYGYYLFGRDMKSVNLNTLASYGTTDLFLNYYAIKLYGKSSVESWIASANKAGIRVHIWMQAFYDGSWINPVSDGVYNKDIFNSRIAEAEEYANLKGVSGIHLDYLRYPGTAYKHNGGTEAISEFTRLVTEKVHSINPNILVSAALMPEPSYSIYYYGQDYSKLTKYLDLVIPMVYKGNYKSGTSWISSTTKWFVDNSKGAQVWVALQAYKSDDDVTKLPMSELNNDIKTTLNAGASGVLLFRYGLSNFPNFKNFK